MAVSIWGASQVKIDFKSTYFISAGAYVKNFLDLQENYFKSGDRINIYSEVPDIDITSYDVQKQMNSFIDKVKKCDGCSKQFTVSDSFDSWYLSLKVYSKN